MMRSLYSGVSGLKTHQTKMDVIGNNIANVNTVAFKSATVTFNEIMYQTLQGASGPNALTGRGGVNAKQIGLGTTSASITNSVTTAGATQTTGSALDVKITGESFFIVSDGTTNFFTRAGSFYIDGAGNLAMTSTGYNVMGWQVDPSTGEIKKDTVSALRIMQAGNLTSAPEATTNAIVTGVLDSNATSVYTDDGYVMNLNFYDSLGYAYTGRFKVSAGENPGMYNVALTDVLDSNGESVLTTVIRTKDLFGTAYAGQQDSGTLKAGRTINSEVIAGTTPEITRYYLTNSEGAEIEDTSIFVGSEDGRFYAYDQLSQTYIPLSNTSEDYQTLLIQEAAHIEQFFQDHYSGIDSDIYITGTSTYTDVTSYITKLSFGSTSMVLDDGYALEVDDTTDPDNVIYTIMKDGETDPEITYKVSKTNNLITAISYTSPTSGATTQWDTTINDETIRNSAFELLTTQIQNATTGAEDTWKAANTDVFSSVVTEEFGYQVAITGTKYYEELRFDTNDGTFMSVANAEEVTLAMSSLGGNFEDITIDFTQVTMYNNGGTSTMAMDKGAEDGSTGAGKKLGAMTGISIDTNGMIYGSYDNGNTVLLGQIAVANFSNPSGLEKVGENCYQTTLNSGEFDGIGVDITADGGSMATGALEMSNVDLSAEFTEMITTQRGFQANSRVITTSDSLLEELINLKR